MQSPSAALRILTKRKEAGAIPYSFSYSPGTQNPLSTARLSHSFGVALEFVVLWHPTRAKAINSTASRRIAFPSKLLAIENHSMSTQLDL